MKTKIKEIWQASLECIDNRIVPVIAAIGIFLAMVLGLACVLAFPVKWLWNWLLPSIFTGVQEVSAVQAWGIVFLIQLLVPKGKPEVLKK